MAPLFEASAADDLRRIMDMVQYVPIPAETVLLSEADPCTRFLFLFEGTVRIYQHAQDGRELTLYRLHPGDVCVMSLNSLLYHRPFNAVAKAETDLQAAALSESDFHYAMANIGGFREHVLKKTSDRFCDVLTLMQDTAFKRLDMRLACLLGSLFERAGSDTLKITHQELARELGTTREVVSRTLKEFERQKCITLSRGQIRVASADGLDWFGRGRDAS
jgi:CRP/FNR family transcriptional regulator